MQRDVRESTLYREAEQFYEAVCRPGTGQLSDAADVHVSPDGTRAVFAGNIFESLAGAPQSRMCLIDLASAETRVLTFGPNTDRLPKFSPDGRRIAFLSDRHQAGDFQLFLLDAASGAARAAPRVQGWIEYLHWSPDGTRILLGVAGHGADIAGAQGAVTSKRMAGESPSWMPAVDTGDESYRWRRAWVYELAQDSVRQVSPAGFNVWEAVWCGDDALAAVTSIGPREGLWYGARLEVIDVRSGGSRELYAPDDQLGWPAASPSGKHLAIVEAVCSDRSVVAGDVKLIDRVSGKSVRVDARGMDVTHTEWRSDQRLLLAGHRGFDTVVGLYDVGSARYSEVWSSREISTGGRHIRVSGAGESGDCVFVGEGFTRAPEIGAIRLGKYVTVKSFDVGYGPRAARAIRSVQCVSWQASDGLEIQGWLLLPEGKGPYPLVMNVHGGPVWTWHPMSLTRGRYAPFFLLLSQGYAVFLPNPRGSSGRGQDFARKVVGDMGGADTNDYLSGLDHLIERGIADPKRLGVSGVSYGGFMASWLITQDARFAAAVPISPSTNQVTQHLVSNIPDFVRLFLKDTYTNPGGRYFERSPIMHAHKTKTPTLNVCGALDRCTPPEEAVQFHNALLENGVKSVLLTYPEEGHGIQNLPAAIDFAARLVGWFQEHMPTSPPARALAALRS